MNFSCNRCTQNLHDQNTCNWHSKLTVQEPKTRSMYTKTRREPILTLKTARPARHLHSNRRTSTIHLQHLRILNVQAAGWWGWALPPDLPCPAPCSQPKSSRLRPAGQQQEEQQDLGKKHQHSFVTTCRSTLLQDGMGISRGNQ